MEASAYRVQIHNVLTAISVVVSTAVVVWSDMARVQVTKPLASLAASILRFIAVLSTTALLRITVRFAGITLLVQMGIAASAAQFTVTATSATIANASTATETMSSTTQQARSVFPAT
jgi:hypothetical protein